MQFKDARSPASLLLALRVDQPADMHVRSAIVIMGRVCVRALVKKTAFLTTYVTRQKLVDRPVDRWGHPSSEGICIFP